jgi:urease accessory protein UreE
MQKDFNNIPLSESNVSLKLADIQKRCAQLIQESGDELGLALEEPVVTVDDSNNPYSRG